MTTYRHVIFLITIVAFLAAFLTFIPGCLMDEDDSRPVVIIHGREADDGWEQEQERVDPWQKWEKTLAEVIKYREAKLFSDAVMELRKFDEDVPDKPPEIKKAYDETLMDLMQAARAEMEKDKEIVRDLIAKEDFPGAAAHINLMKQRYRGEAFSWAEFHIGIVEKKWRDAEAIFRGKVFVIESGASLEEARQIVRKNISGKDIRDFGAYAITYPPGAGSIVIDFKLNAKRTYSLPLSFNLHGARQVRNKPGSWELKELKALQLNISCPRGTEIRVAMTGGSGTSYSAEKTLGAGGGYTAFSFATDFQATGGVMNKVSEETTINSLVITITVQNDINSRRTLHVSLNNVAFVP